jgi:hypothetical protein
MNILLAMDGTEVLRRQWGCLSIDFGPVTLRFVSYMLSSG